MVLFLYLRKKHFLNIIIELEKNLCYYEISFPESVEVDTPEDLNLARKICK